MLLLHYSSVLAGCAPGVISSCLHGQEWQALVTWSGAAVIITVSMHHDSAAFLFLCSIGSRLVFTLGMSAVALQDTAASDSMEAAMRLIHLNGMMRTAVRLIRGVKIGLDEQHFHFGVFSVISWFKIYEHYTLGEVCLNRRRDLRRGVCKGCEPRGIAEFWMQVVGLQVNKCVRVCAGAMANSKLLTVPAQQVLSCMCLGVAAACCCRRGSCSA